MRCTKPCDTPTVCSLFGCGSFKFEDPLPAWLVGPCTCWTDPPVVDLECPLHGEIPEPVGKIPHRPVMITVAPPCQDFARRPASDDWQDFPPSMPGNEASQ